MENASNYTLSILIICDTLVSERASDLHQIMSVSILFQQIRCGEVKE
jgi:hypothetical protein